MRPDLNGPRETHACDCKHHNGKAFSAPVGLVERDRNYKTAVHNWVGMAHTSAMAGVLFRQSGVKAV